MHCWVIVAIERSKAERISEVNYDFVFRTRSSLAKDMFRWLELLHKHELFLPRRHLSDTIIRLLEVRVRNGSSPTSVDVPIILSTNPWTEGGRQVKRYASHRVLHHGLYE